MSYLKIRGLCHRYGRKLVLDDFSLDADQGEFISLLGPSGCGKTTILKLIAGFETPESGTIEINGTVLNKVPSHKRNMGMVFQSYALFPHMSLIDNVAYGLRQRKMGRKQARASAGEALELVRLSGFADRRPDQLSGGQQQRVALARAIVIRPGLLLLDESLSALDRKLRVEMQVELRKIQQTVGITTLFVTHDQEEALTLSDRVALLDKGKVVQYDTPDRIYEQPRNRFVAGFLGQANFLEGIVFPGREELYEMELKNGNRFRFGCAACLPPQSRCLLAVRPEKMSISPEPSPARPVQGVVSLVTYAGGTTQYNIDALGKNWIVQTQNARVSSGLFSVGDPVWIGWEKENCLVLDVEKS
ncbi:ABC transporter ATP-binding protein [Desulfospira joergensenii]|uniref:ABC transporter ATP-binding protein n=1 Tax=Desulfospira joergensenii TaxID=53329 RepID=UPI0003B517ED|nr:ABC transporter ATP-binding protein [Desulfospira joergensenii]